MNELKPCPFCGGDASMYDMWGGYAVGCFSSGCPITPRLPVFNDKQVAVDAWNTRAERTCHVETVPLGIHDDTTADVCSECRVPLDGDEYYCPNCGAKVVE